MKIKTWAEEWKDGKWVSQSPTSIGEIDGGLDMGAIADAAQKGYGTDHLCRFVVEDSNAPGIWETFEVLGPYRLTNNDVDRVIDAILQR